MSKKKKRNGRDESIVFAWLAAFFTIVGFVIVLILKRDDAYVIYYAKQGLVLFVGFAIGSVFQFVPIVGQLFMLFIFILWVFAWVNALSGKRRRTWIVQDLAEKIKL